MVRLKLLLFVCILALYGCSNRSKTVAFNGEKYDKGLFDSIKQMDVDVSSLQTIDLRKVFRKHSLDFTVFKEAFDFSSLIDSYELVFLETNEASLIGEISRVIRKDGLIFVLDTHKTNRLLVFDEKGKYIRSIGRQGNGPGEYVQATDFDYERGVVFLFDNLSNSISEYDTSGVFLAKRKIPLLSMFFVKVGEEFVYQNILGNNHVNKISRSSISVGTSDKAITKTGLTMLKYNFISDRISKINDSTALYSIPYNDTIYHYEKGDLDAMYVLQFPKTTKLPKNFMNETGSDYDRFRKMFPKDRFTYYEYGCWESDNYLIVNVAYDKAGYSIYYNKNSKKLFYGTKCLNSQDRLEKLLAFSNPISAYNEEFIVPIYFPLFVADMNMFFKELPKAERKALYSKYPKLENWNSDDNPILSFIKYK